MMIRHSRKKGQYIVIQEVLVYGMGLFMLIGVLSTFTYMKTTIQDSVRENQLEIVSNLVVNGIEDLKQSENQSQMKIPLPEKLVGKQYSITTSFAGFYMLTVTDGHFVHRQSLSIPVNDTVIRGDEYILITHWGDYMQLRGV